MAAGRESHTSYVLPRHRTEVDRLDVQHYPLREALDANYLAPVRSPTVVLDAGTGTGQWAYEVWAGIDDRVGVVAVTSGRPDR